MRNNEHYWDPTASIAIAKNNLKGVKKMEIYRGDIFFVKKFGYKTGSEQHSGRPAVVVSNDIGNKHSNTCEIVYLTSKRKKPLPTHVDIMCKIPSVALCEQIYSVSKDRLVEYVRECTEAEMKEIDRALMISLGLDLYMKK